MEESANYNTNTTITEIIRYLRIAPFKLETPFSYVMDQINLAFGKKGF